MKYLLTIVLLFSFGQANAVGGYKSGNELLGYCDLYLTDPGRFNGGLCAGYILGVVDAAGSYEAWGVMTQPFCVPIGVTVGQLVQIAYKSLKEEPETLHLLASGLVANALTEAFPCE